MFTDITRTYVGYWEYKVIVINWMFVPSQNLRAQALPFDLALSGDKDAKEVIKVKRGHKGETLN